MQDTKLFETILGIQTPWRISRVALDTTGERVEPWAEHADTRWTCPECAQELPCHDHADENVWRTSTRVSTKRSSTRACHGSIARRAACSRCVCPEPRPAVGSRCRWSG